MCFREVEKILRKDGWKVVRIKGSHYQFANEKCPGHVVTVPCHGSKDISRTVLKNLREGTGLSFKG